MNIVKATLIALTVVSAGATSAYAHTEFRDRDALQGEAIQGSIDAYAPTGVYVSGADREIVGQNARDPK